jgi:pimeloyl-ACP methyl ester carboxylesterase
MKPWIAACFLSAALHITTPLNAEPPKPQMLPLSTGSTVATWRVPAASKDARKTPVIFLHGGPGLYTEARRIAEGAVFRAHGFETIYFDQAGGGKSAKIPVAHYGLERAVADLEALRIAQGHERMVLWGNSYGASLAAVYADRFPQRVAAMVLTSPGMFPGFEGKRDYGKTNRDRVEYSKALTAAISKIDKNAVAAEASLSQTDASKLFDELVGSELIDGVICKGSAIRPEPLPGGGNLYAQRLISRDVKKFTFRPAARKPLPTLIVRGTCDFLPLSSAEKYQQAFGGEIMSVADSGHGLLEHRDKVDMALETFVKARLGGVE